MNGESLVLVLVEAQAAEPTRASLQAIAAARGLADAAGGRVEAVAFADDAAEAAASYVPVVHRAELPQENQETRARALTAALATTEAAVLIAAGTRTTSAVAPRVALRAGEGGVLLEDVTTLAFAEGAVVATRLTQLQRVMETVRADGAPVVATTRIGAFEPATPAASRGEVRPLDVPYEASDARVEVRVDDSGGGTRMGLEEADVIVVGGRGVGSAEAFDSLVAPLAARLGGTVGATRAVVDSGWRPYGEQIGQTGKTVAPGIYVALGVSGAVQHLSGMNRSRRVVAINKDADAPIFRHCDVGVVGDVHEVVPALLAALGDG